MMKMVYFRSRLRVFDFLPFFQRRSPWGRRYGMRTRCTRCTSTRARSSQATYGKAPNSRETVIPQFPEDLDLQNPKSQSAKMPRPGLRPGPMDCSKTRNPHFRVQTSPLDSRCRSEGPARAIALLGPSALPLGRRKILQADEAVRFLVQVFRKAEHAVKP